jgi:probable addiction module antidote protein
MEIRFRLAYSFVWTRLIRSFPKPGETSLARSVKVFDPQTQNDSVMISKYLTEALRSDDLVVIAHAIGNVLRAQNVMALSRETGLQRENLYKMFNGHRDPRLGNIMKILASFGVQLTVTPRTEGKTRGLAAIVTSGSRLRP